MRVDIARSLLTSFPTETTILATSMAMLRGGADIVLASELLGHASLDATRVYTLSTAADRERAVELLRTDH